MGETDMASGVSFVCPECNFLCGWNDKKRFYDAVEVPGPKEGWKQYAHEKCVKHEAAGPDDECEVHGEGCTRHSWLPEVANARET